MAERHYQNWLPAAFERVRSSSGCSDYKPPRTARTRSALALPNGIMLAGVP